MKNRVCSPTTLIIAALAATMLAFPSAALAAEESGQQAQPTGSAASFAQDGSTLVAQGLVQDAIKAWEKIYGLGSNSPEGGSASLQGISARENTFGVGYGVITWDYPNTGSYSTLMNYTVEVKHPVTQKWYKVSTVGPDAARTCKITGLSSDYDYEVRITAKMMVENGSFNYCFGSCTVHTAPGAVNVKTIKAKYLHEKNWPEVNNYKYLAASWQDPPSFKWSTHGGGYLGEMRNAKGKLVFRGKPSNATQFVQAPPSVPDGTNLSASEKKAIGSGFYREFCVSGREVCTIRLKAYEYDRNGHISYGPWSSWKTCVPYPEVFGGSNHYWKKLKADQQSVTEVRYPGALGAQKKTAPSR